jgi:regulator of sigma E protease
LPLGGYVKLLDEREGNVAPGERHRSFNAQPVYQRILVLLAGPAFNFLFAIVAYWAVFVHGVPVLRAVVGDVEPGSIAAVAGLRYGDTILQVGERKITSWQDGLLPLVDELVDDAEVPLVVQRADGRDVELILRADTETARLSKPGALFQELGFSLWSPPAVIGEVNRGTPAARAGLLAGDRILSISGEPVDSWNDVVTLVRDAGGTVLQLEIERDGRRSTIEVTPELVTLDDGTQTAQLGITSSGERPEYLTGVERYGPLESIGVAGVKTVELTGITLKMFGRMVTGSVSLKNVSGPLNIAEFAGATLSRGFVDFMEFLALISVSLGVLNLLPIPMLDGGQIVYQSVEGITGRPLSERAQMIGQQLGIILLLGVMSLAFYNDIARYLERLLG